MNPDVTLPAYEPYLGNGHVQTLLANFWPRPVTEARYPIVRRLYATEPGVQIAVDEQFPSGSKPRAHAVLVHGLEGSAQSGYIRSLSRDLLDAGYAIHRFHMRSCGGTEHLAPSNYHSGQTSDALSVISTIRSETSLPIFLVGFSLGGNMSLKLAGELGRNGGHLLAAVCAVSTPIDLAACSRKIGHPSNVLYEKRFLRALKDRIRRRHASYPERFRVEPLKSIRSIWDFDDTYTAKEFGFETAENYYRTQSANQFLERIGIPALLIQAKDDPMIPFEVYDHPGIRKNPLIRLVAFEHGGHVGFVSRRQPRFWIDPLITGWLERVRESLGNPAAKRAVFE